MSIAGLLIPANLDHPARVVELVERPTIRFRISPIDVADMLAFRSVEAERLAADAWFWFAPARLTEGTVRANRRMTNLRDAEVLLHLGRRSAYAVAGDALVTGTDGAGAAISVPDRILADVARAGWLT